MYLIVIGWLYVTLMMAIAEATNSMGSVVGALFTFLLYGALPVALVVYLIATPSRKKAIEARDTAELTRQAGGVSNTPDRGSETPADAVSPVGKEH